MDKEPTRNLNSAVATELDLAFQNLAMKSIELSIGRVLMDNLLAQADYQLIAFEDLAKGLQAWVRVMSLASRDVLLNLTRQGEAARLLMEADIRLPTWLLHTLKAMELRIGRFQPAGDAPMWQWQIAHRQCWQEAKTIGLTNCVRAEHNQLIIKAPLLKCAYPDELPRIPELLDVYTQQILTDPGPVQNLVSRCKELLQRALPETLKVPQLAAALQMSPRSLQRQLQDASASYSELLAEVRQVKARSRLSDSKVPIHKLALELGFSEPASFIRAFKQFEGCAPAEYRRQVRKQRVEAEHMPIRFLYAENTLQVDNQYHRRGARVWMEVLNLAYSKEVTVDCEDLDGTWRHYACTFERWLGPGRELWSSVNIPVFDPLRFRLNYRVGHILHADDNDGRDFTLTCAERYLLGAHAFAVLSLQQIIFASRNLLVAKILTEHRGEDRLLATIVDRAADFRQEAEAECTFTNEHDVICWHLFVELDNGISPLLTFKHLYNTGMVIEDNAGEGYLPE